MPNRKRILIIHFFSASPNCALIIPFPRIGLDKYLIKKKIITKKKMLSELNPNKKITHLKLRTLF